MSFHANLCYVHATPTREIVARDRARPDLGTCPDAIIAAIGCGLGGAHTSRSYRDFDSALGTSGPDSALGVIYSGCRGRAACALCHRRLYHIPTPRPPCPPPAPHATVETATTCATRDARGCHRPTALMAPCVDPLRIAPRAPPLTTLCVALCRWHMSDGMRPSGMPQQASAGAGAVVALPSPTEGMPAARRAPRCARGGEPHVLSGPLAARSLGRRGGQT